MSSRKLTTVVEMLICRANQTAVIMNFAMERTHSIGTLSDV